jgi:hypothetical protein
MIDARWDHTEEHKGHKMTEKQYNVDKAAA